MERKSEPTRYEQRSRARIQSLVTEFCDGSQQQLADRTGVNKASISQYVNGKNVPSNLTAKKLCRPFGINPAWIMGFDVPKHLPVDETGNTSGDRVYPTIPVLGAIAAGEPILMSEHEIDRIPFYPNYRENLFALVVKGESMAPRIQDGDLIVAIAQNDVNNGEIAIVAVNGDEATCKRVYKSPEGITLVADNAAVYPPHFYGPGDDPVKVLGKVVEIRAKA